MKVSIKRKLIVASIISLILILSTVGMLLLKSMRPEPTKKLPINTTLLVEVLELYSADVTFEIKSQGIVIPRTETILSAEVSGRIIAISEKFIAGGIFQKDEILMQIDPTYYAVVVEQAEALVKQRQIEYKGAKSLRKKGFRAEAELAAASASLTLAKSSLVKAKMDLDRTKIRLPYLGMVKNKNSDLGQYVSRGTRLGTTFAINTVEVRLPLTDQDLAFLDLPNAADIAERGWAIGPSVTLSAIREGKQQHWLARIIRTEGIIDPNSRVTYAVAQIDDPYQLLSNQSELNASSVLPVGTFVSAMITGKQFTHIVKVPRTAIRGKNELLFIDSNNQLQIRKVAILRADTQFAYIKEGINDNERISLTAIESPINGMKVRTIIDQTLVKKSNAEKEAETRITQPVTQH